MLALEAGKPLTSPKIELKSVIAVPNALTTHMIKTLMIPNILGKREAHLAILDCHTGMMQLVSGL